MPTFLALQFLAIIAEVENPAFAHLGNHPKYALLFSTAVLIGLLRLIGHVRRKRASSSVSLGGESPGPAGLSYPSFPRSPRG